MSLRAVIGLGNPGREYEKTRHNIGFMVVQKLASKLNASFRYEERFEGWRASSAIEKASSKPARCELFLPATYMNESGRAVQRLLRYFQIEPRDILVVVDDMDLPFGKQRLKALGGPGGHNGLKSLIRDLGTQGFPRLKIGIGKAPSSHVDYVLDKFSQAEQAVLEEILEKAVTCVMRLAFEDLSKVATDVNRLEDLKKKDVL